MQINTENVKNAEGRPGPSPPASCAATRASRSSSAARCTSHTPFPNIVYALDLTKEGAPIKWKYAPKQDPEVIPIACCDTVNRGLAYRRRQDLPESARHHHRGARCRNRARKSGRSSRATTSNGQTITIGADGRQGQGHLGHQRRRVRRARLRDRQRRQDRQAGVADVQHRPRGRSRVPRLGRDLEGRRVEARRRHHVGLVQLRPRAEPDLLRHRQPGIVESRSASRRQQVLDDDLRAQSRHGRRRSGRTRRRRTTRWDYDGINENVLVDLNVNGQTRKVLVNFDRNGFAYTLDRTTGELLHGRAVRRSELGDRRRPEDRASRSRCRRSGPRRRRTPRTSVPSAMGGKNQQPVAVLAAARSSSTCRPTTCAWTTRASR